MVAYTISYVNSEQGQSVIWQHIIELPVTNLHNFKIRVLVPFQKVGGRKDIPTPQLSGGGGGGATAPAASPVPTPMI